MGAEFSFFGFERPEADGLFFAILPEGKDALRLATVARQLCIRHRLGSRPLAAERFHVSLFGFGPHAGLPQDLVAGVIETAATVAMPAFNITFDHAMSFLGRSRPLVLCGGEGVAGLIALQRALGNALQKGGLGRVKPQYTPHLTLLYDECGIKKHAIEPIGWTVSEFVLVHSLLGQGQYNVLRRWRLRG
jgi:2'-5' RNA ligase